MDFMDFAVLIVARGFIRTPLGPQVANLSVLGVSESASKLGIYK